MRTARSILSACAVGFFLTAGAVTQSNAAAGFDGEWSVAIQTTQGKCGSYRAGLQVAGGRVLSAPGDYAVSGTVSAQNPTGKGGSVNVCRPGSLGRATRGRSSVV